MATPPKPARREVDDPIVVTAATTVSAPTVAPTTEPSPPTPRERWSRAVAQLRTPSASGSVEPISPHVAPPDPGSGGPGGPGDLQPVLRTARSRWSSSVLVVAAIVVGLAGALILAGTAPFWYLAPPSWRLSVPGLLSPGDPMYSAITFVLAVVLMCLGWVGLVGHMRRGTGSRGARTLWVVAAATLWSIPLLLGPIQLSSDAYSYGAQGLLADLGMDPTTVGPNALPNHISNDFWQAADPIWRSASAPYGPVAIGLAKANVVLTGYDVTNAARGFRALAVAGVVMTGVGVYLIARKRRVSPPLALALAVANPVVLIHLVGGAHNDALMMGFLVLGLAAFEKGRKILAVVLVALAVSVKLPAVIALAFIAWNWSRDDAPWKERVRNFAIVGAITGAVIGIGCLVVGIGVGWIFALQNTGKITSTFAVFTKLGFLIADLFHAVGLDVDVDLVVNVVRLLGLLTATAVILVLMVKSPKIGVSKAVGLSLLVFVLCSPVIWPWYLPAAFALLAATGLRTYRPSLIVLVVSSSLLVFPTSVNSVSSLTPYQHWLGFGVAVLIGVACVAAQYLSARVSRYRADHGYAPLLSGDADEDGDDVRTEVADRELVAAG